MNENDAERNAKIAADIARHFGPQPEAEEGDPASEQISLEMDRPGEPQTPEPSALAEANASAPRGRPFPKGASGNPTGRPAGARSKATRLAQSQLEEHAKRVIDLLLDKALEGNMPALKLCVDRILPRPRQAAITLDFPDVENLKRCGEAVSTLISAAAAGELTFAEAEALAKLVDIRRRCAETKVSDQLKALEADAGGS